MNTKTETPLLSLYKKDGKWLINWGVGCALACISFIIGATYVSDRILAMLLCVLSGFFCGMFAVLLVIINVMAKNANK